MGEGGGGTKWREDTEREEERTSEVWCYIEKVIKEGNEGFEGVHGRVRDMACQGSVLE